MVWFAVVVVIWLYFLKRRTLVQLYCGSRRAHHHGLCKLQRHGSVAISDRRLIVTDTLIWSRTTRSYIRRKRKLINTNNIGHQQMVQIQEAGPAYSLPHLLNRDAGGRPFRKCADHRRGFGKRRECRTGEWRQTCGCGRDRPGRSMPSAVPSMPITHTRIPG